MCWLVWSIAHLEEMDENGIIICRRKLKTFGIIFFGATLPKI
jgi:hypothetical protein